MKRRNVSVLILVSILTIFAFQGCIGTNTSSISASVEMVNKAFVPATLGITSGTTVTWYNNDTVTHTVTSDDGSFPSSGNIAPGQTYSVTFNQTGTFGYHCSIHIFMRAEIIVQ